MQAGTRTLVIPAAAPTNPSPPSFCTSKGDMEGEDGMDVDDQVPEAVQAAAPGPVVDEDGFELVQRKSGRKGRR